MVYCGIDIGTTNVKGIVLGDDGGVLGSASFASSELVAGGDRWYGQFCEVMDHFFRLGVFKGQRVVCCVGCQGGSFVLIDDEMKALCDVNLWTAKSAEGVVDKYLKHYNGDDFYRLTGWRPASWMPLFKLKEMGFEEGELVAFVSDYIYGRLTGELVTDITNAQMTGLADFENGCWDSNIISWAGLYEGDLPEIKNKVEVLFTDVSTSWGKIDIVTSLHDQYAAMNAVDLKVGKDIMLATGTAWVINFRSEEPTYDDSYKVHPGRDIITGAYGNICSMSSVGAGFDELLRQVGFDYNKLGELESDLKELAIPERAVSFDLSDIGGCGFAGLEAVRNYMAWAASMVRHHLESLGLLDGLEEIIMTGGAVRSGVWPGVVADICGVDVKVVMLDELTAYGAAIAAAGACGLEAIGDISGVAETVVYKPLRVDEYKFWYEKFQKGIFE